MGGFVIKRSSSYTILFVITVDADQGTNTIVERLWGEETLGWSLPSLL